MKLAILKIEILKTVRPELYYKFKNKRNGIIVRDKIKGDLLYDVISNFDINTKKRHNKPTFKFANYSRKKWFLS